MISRDKMLALYAAMVKCRKVAEQADRATHAQTAANKSGGVAGWEATIAGITADLLPGDKLGVPKRCVIYEALTAIRTGGAVHAFATPANGKSSSDGNHKPFDFVRPRAGSIAADDGFDDAFRAAHAFKSTKDQRVVVLFGDNQGDMQRWRDRLIEIARGKPPLLIVTRHRTPDPRSLFSTQPKSRKQVSNAMAFGVPVIAVDGNDVLAVYRVASESIFKARHRRGPTLIECVTSVVPGSNGDSTHARQGIGVLDPLLALETDLVRKGILTTVRKRESRR